MTVADLSPDALARLEAKLVADLEMVRKVRALLEEHGAFLRGAGPTAPVSQTSTPAPAIPPVDSVSPPPPPRKPIEELMMDCLKSLAGLAFTTKELKSRFYKINITPKDSRVKSFLARMIREGKVVVLAAGVGRGGSTYRCTLPRETVNALLPAEDSPVPAAETTVDTSLAPVPPSLPPTKPEHSTNNPGH